MRKYLLWILAVVVIMAIGIFVYYKYRASAETACNPYDTPAENAAIAASKQKLDAINTLNIKVQTNFKSWVAQDYLLGKNDNAGELKPAVIAAGKGSCNVTEGEERFDGCQAIKDFLNVEFNDAIESVRLTIRSAANIAPNLQQDLPKNISSMANVAVPDVRDKPVSSGSVKGSLVLGETSKVTINYEIEYQRRVFTHVIKNCQTGSCYNPAYGSWGSTVYTFWYLKINSIVGNSGPLATDSSLSSPIIAESGGGTWGKAEDCTQLPQFPATSPTLPGSDDERVP